MKVKKITSTFLIVLLIVTVCAVAVSMSDAFGNGVGDIIKEHAHKHTLEKAEGKEATCLEGGWNEYSYCTECDYTTKEEVAATGHKIVFEVVDSTPTYSCSACDITYVPTDVYYCDGTTNVGLASASNNSGNFTTQTGMELPAIVDGHYEFLKTSSYDTSAQAQLWIPAAVAGFSDFSSENNAVGILSFKINTNLDEYFEMILVEGDTTNRWEADWCIQNPVIKIANHGSPKDYVYYDIYGGNGAVLKTVVDINSEFTGWIDVQIGIELDEETDTVIFHYYINSEYLGSETTSLTTKNNSIRCLYVNCRTKGVDTGYMIDDIVFGYTKNGEWNFN